MSDWTVTLTATMTLTLIPNPNPTEGKREILRLNFFESYFEVDDIFWGRWQAGAKNVFVRRIVGLCRSVWCLIDRAVIQRYILSGWQAGAKNVFACIILGLCRSVCCCVDRTDIQQYILWTGLFVQKFLAYVTWWSESDTLLDRLSRKHLCVWNCTRTHGKLQFILLCLVVWT